MENPTPTHWKASLKTHGPTGRQGGGSKTKGGRAAVYSFPILVRPTYLGFINEHKRGVRDRTTLAAAHSLDLTVGLSTGSTLRQTSNSDLFLFGHN